MKFTTIATLLAAAAGVSATCYNSGETWGDQNVALEAIKNECDWFFKGTYGPAGTPSGYKGKCVNANGKKLEFQLWHVSGGDRQIDAAECYDGFRKEITGCTHGGKSKYSNWEYK